MIGTGLPISEVRRFFSEAQASISAGTKLAKTRKRNDGKPVSPRIVALDPMLHPDFPGFSFEHPFHCDVHLVEDSKLTLTEGELSDALNRPDRRSKILAVGDLIRSRLLKIKEMDPTPQVAFIALPSSVYAQCEDADYTAKKPKLGPRKPKVHQRVIDPRQLDLFADSLNEEEEIEFTPLGHNLHDLVKVLAMHAGIPTQFLWEGTLSKRRGTQDPASIAWNILTALYYKAGHLPWRLDISDRDCCFLGISFHKLDPSNPADVRATLAQAFSQTGEGFVMKGERATVDDTDRQAHLSADGAQRIVEQTLEMYKRHHPGLPGRVVIHKTSRFSEAELAGFKAGLTGVRARDFVAIMDRGIRFVRLGEHPPIRGTVIELASRHYLLYTHGYIPYIREYPGPRVPAPLEIVEHHGDSSGDQICKEILALTKLNWNNCQFASSDPITIAFSRRVGRLLRELGESPLPQYLYRYFM